MKGLLSAVELLQRVAEEHAHYDDFQDGVSKIQPSSSGASAAERAQAFAQEYKDDKSFYTVASGAGLAQPPEHLYLYGNAMDTFAHS